MNSLQNLIERQLAAALKAVRALRARAIRFARQNPLLDSGQLVAKVQAELGATEPRLARAIETGILAAWLGAARGPARDAAPPSRDVFGVEPPVPPGPPSGAPFDPEEGGIRFPGIEAAVRDLMARDVLTEGEFLRLAEDARAAAFTVARVVSAEGVAAVRDALARDLSFGGGLREFGAAVGPILEEAGFSDAQVETLYRTQTALASSVGQRAVLEHPLVGDEFPYVAYDATHDSRVRPDHLALERCGIQGTNVYRCDDPVVRRYWAPWGYNCRCVCRLLTVEDAAAAGVTEAREWMRTGRPPDEPAFVPDPGFPLPKGWPGGGAVAPVVSG